MFLNVPWYGWMHLAGVVWLLYPPFLWVEAGLNRNALGRFLCSAWGSVVSSLPILILCIGFWIPAISAGLGYYSWIVLFLAVISQIFHFLKGRYSFSLIRTIKVDPHVLTITRADIDSNSLEDAILLHHRRIRDYRIGVMLYPLRLIIAISAILCGILAAYRVT
jgi:hypothetical protein